MLPNLNRGGNQVTTTPAVQLEVEDDGDEIDEETGQKRRNLQKLRQEFKGLALPDKSVYDLIDLDKLDREGDEK